MKKPPLPPSIRLAIVDSVPHDYGDLLAAAGSPGASIHFIFSGNDAVLFARRWPAALWVVNSRLSDMSGFELAGLLRSLRPNATIFIIGDHYELSDELQTMTLGLAKYLCKPLEPFWVLPQEGASCIPLPALRRADASLASDSSPDEPETPTALALFTAVNTEPTPPDWAVLPFSRSPMRRPAA